MPNAALAWRLSATLIRSSPDREGNISGDASVANYALTASTSGGRTAAASGVTTGNKILRSTSSASRIVFLEPSHSRSRKPARSDRARRDRHASDVWAFPVWNARRFPTEHPRSRATIPLATVRGLLAGITLVTVGVLGLLAQARSADVGDVCRAARTIAGDRAPPPSDWARDSCFGA